MSDFSEKHRTTYINTLIYENFILKNKYNELWQKYQVLQHEWNQSNNNDDIIIENDPKIISHLQTKISDLMKTIVKKNNEIAELKKFVPP